MGAYTRILPSHRRKLIEAEIELCLRRVERLIARLDRADGDPDLEDDDPAGGAIDDQGEGDELLPLLPVYVLDQTSGPINERAALRERHRRMMLS